MIPTLLIAAVLLPAQPPAKPAVSLADRLAEKVSTPEGLEGKYREVGAKIAAKFELPLVFGPEWKRKYESGDAEEPTVKVPVLKNVRLGTLLRVFVEMGDGAYLVHPDTVRIVPDVSAWYESGARPMVGDENELFLPATDLERSKPLAMRALLTKNYKEESLRTILADIASTTGATVILAPTAQKAVGVEDPEKFKLTASFANTPVDAAVRTLADMSDLAVLPDANVLLVTTPDKVRQRLEAEREKKQMQAPLGFGLAGAAVAHFHPFPASADKSKAEIADLQKQTAELKKQIEELQKKK